MSETVGTQLKCAECGEGILREEDAVWDVTIDVVEDEVGGTVEYFPGKMHVTYRHRWCEEGSGEWLK